MGDLDIRIRHGGGGGDGLAVLAKIAAVAVPCAAVYIAAQWVAHLPVYVSAGIPLAAVAGLVVAFRAQIHRNRSKGADVAAAWSARREAIEAAEESRRVSRRTVAHAEALALAAAGAPVIHNNVTVDADAIAAALYRQHTQTATACGEIR